MKSLIFGYGITGQSFERYLIKKGIAFDIYDENLKGPNIYNQLPDQAELSSYEMIYLSPGSDRSFHKNSTRLDQVIDCIYLALLDFHRIYQKLCPFLSDIFQKIGL